MAASVNIPVGQSQVSGLLEAPRDARALFVVAHGAGAGMRHAFLEAVADGLAQRRVATLRYQFPYMERGSKRPDSPKVAHAAVRAAVEAAGRHLPELPLFAGGKSFGGRMTSQAQAAAPLPGVRGLIFLGFPLHAPGKASAERGEHLADVRVPMLFLQGTRDDFARLELLQPLVTRVGATMRLFEDADHSFHVPARRGKDADVMAAMLDVISGWIEAATVGGAAAPTASGPRRKS
jgi:predicted alpha/beta-hydrolase family hydrolase